ncbi:hypothetical protein ACI2KR_27650 [Pseudomonas luteola]
MLWEINSPKGDRDQFENIRIKEILYEFDGPKIFTTGASDNLLQLWYECGEDYESETIRFLVVPTNRNQIDLLKQGSRTVHDLLKQPWIWAVDLDFDFDLRESWVLNSLDEVPVEAKPEPYATLNPEHMPLLSYRLIGLGLKEGCIPSSVVNKAINGPTSALKKLLEVFGGGFTQGRPEENFRKAYDLPATRFSYNSFEVSFGLPSGPQLTLQNQEQPIYEAGSESLEKAFCWLEKPDHTDEPPIGILEALKELVPPAHGQVEQAELRGKIINRLGPVILTRQHRKSIIKALNNKKDIEEPLVQVKGKIREFDKDNFSFILRNRAEDEVDLRCIFTEDKYDDLYEYFYEDTVVNIAGRLKNSKNILEVVDVDHIRNDGIIDNSDLQAE